MKIGIIITPERKKDKIINAFIELGVEYEFINLLDDDWELYFKEKFDGYLIYPPSFPDSWKNIFFKRLFLLNDKLLGKSLPSLEAILIYESKISMLDYYKINNLPHVKSYSFYNYQKALAFGRACELPIVLKEDSGSGAIGVRVIRSRRKLLSIIRKSFYRNNKIRKYEGFQTISKLIKSRLYPYKIFMDTNKKYLPKNSKTIGSIHMQKHLKIKNEWRVIRIGDSFFGHKKLEDKHGFHSGSLNKGWGHVNKDLLNLVKKWSDELRIESMCFDIFEDENGRYFINELQTMFGTSTESQLMVNDKAGRYIHNKSWIFEEGNFTRNGCNNLRLEFLLKKINE